MIAYVRLCNLSNWLFCNGVDLFYIVLLLYIQLVSFGRVVDALVSQSSWCFNMLLEIDNNKLSHDSDYQQLFNNSNAATHFATTLSEFVQNNLVIIIIIIIEHEFIWT